MSSNINYPDKGKSSMATCNTKPAILNSFLFYFHQTATISML